MSTKEKGLAPIAVVLIIVGVLVLGASGYFVMTKVLCVKEGETIGARGMPESCCPGLKAIGGWPGGYQGDCSILILPPPTGLNICANCGNKICEPNNGENKCNCPGDCAGDQTAQPR